MAESKIKNDQLIAEEYTKDYTVNASTTQTIDFTPSKSNYRAIGVVGSSTGHGSVLIQQCRFINSTTVRITVRNITNSAITATARITALYQPN